MNAQVTLITFNVNTTATLVLHVLLLFGFRFLTSFFWCYIFQFTSCLKSMTLQEGNGKITLSAVNFKNQRVQLQEI